MVDKVEEARTLLIELAKKDGAAGMSVQDLKSIDPYALAKALNVDGKDGLTRKDIEEGVYGFVKDDVQRKAATDSLIANLNVAFEGTGIKVKEDPQPERFNINNFGRDTAFPRSGNDKKIAQFVEFAKNGGLESLSKAEFENIHHAYFRALEKNGIQLPEAVAERLTRSQRDSYKMGERAPFLSDYRPDQIVGYAGGSPITSGIPNIRGQAQETVEVETLTGMARFGKDTKFPRSGNEKKIQAFVELAKDGQLEYLDPAALQNIHHAYFRALKDKGVDLPESVTSKLNDMQRESYKRGQDAPFISEYRPDQIVGYAGSGQFSSPIFGGTPNISGEVARAAPQPIGGYRGADAGYGFSNPNVEAQIADIRAKLTQFAGADGKMSDLEYGKGDRQRAREVMRGYDLNHDGKVDSNEVKKVHGTQDDVLADKVLNALHRVNDSNNQNPNNHLPGGNGFGRGGRW